MDERVTSLRSLEPKNSGRASYLAILEAAAGLFGQFPAEDITLTDILGTAGVSNQTLYNYFPNGRDDVAVALYDRYQATMVEDFNHQIQFIEVDSSQGDSCLVHRLSACLARAVFGFLSESRPIQATLVEYLRQHNLLMTATHTGELEAALVRALATHLGDRMRREELPRVARLSVCIVREVGRAALRDGAFAIDQLESNARKMVRTLLATGLKEQDDPSGFHAFHSYTPAPMAILGAPISPAKRQGILERILKRKGRG